MIKSIHDPSVTALFKSLRTPATKTVDVDGKPIVIPSPFPSPIDWRDVWIYQLIVDRFNNPKAPPKAEWNGENRYVFQGGTIAGIREKLPYLQQLGVGAIWLNPVQKNCAYRPSYHGYAVQDFLAIDPRLSSNPKAAQADPKFVEDELQALIDEIHARGMYVVFDIVLHHTGDVFAYALEDGTSVSKAPFRNEPYPEIHWRDAKGLPQPKWTEIEEVGTSDPDVGVYPIELRANKHFHRQGEGWELEADFKSLKTIYTDGTTDASETLIRIYQYLVGRFDVDAFRVDAFKHIDKGFGRTFCNAMREFAASIGKKNFFIFCEVFDGEDMISQYVGRNTSIASEQTQAADAALDFPLMFVLPDVAKGIRAPSELAKMFDHRHAITRNILSSHGEANTYFVTFLDNHDQYQRIYYSLPDAPNAYDDQLIIALGTLFGLQGIPCVYYGTEQGMRGRGNSEEVVREALWGAPDPFNQQHAFYVFLQQVAKLRSQQSPLRYGRQYFRPVSVNEEEFALSYSPGQPIAFSRVLAEHEVLIVANPDLKYAWTGFVIVDIVLNAHGEAFDTLLSTKTASAAPTLYARTLDGGVARYLPVTLQPGEFRILSNRN